MNYSQIMVDIETMATQPNAALASIGACKFTWKGEVVSEFYINVDVEDCKRYGLLVSKSTIEWWMSQPKPVRNALLVDPKPLAFALNAFNEWVESNKHDWWCNGMNFDFPILEEAYIRTGIEKPWHYRRLNDYRTVMNLFGVRNDLMRQNQEADTYHNALADAKWQAKVLTDLIGEHKLNA